MARIKIKSTVGLRRLTAGRGATLQAFTRSTRESMRTVAKNLEEVVNKIQGATPEAIEYGLKPMWDLSQKYVPVDTGDLKSSGQFLVEQRGDKIEASISYGLGGKPEYAVYVHERLDVSHKAPTRAKFLQTAMNEKLGRVRPRVREFLRRETGLK